MDASEAIAARERTVGILQDFSRMPKTPLSQIDERKSDSGSEQQHFFVELFQKFADELFLYECICLATDVSDAKTRVRREFLAQHPELDDVFTVDVRATPLAEYTEKWLQRRSAGFVLIDTVDERWRALGAKA